MQKTAIYLVAAINFYCVNPLFSQKEKNDSLFQSPLDIPLFLSGNYGEIRANHFHAGIDIKTEAVTGKKVYSVAEGYISRIKIESGGYGKALYIDHPSGYTSVYAHLNEFTPEIEEYVKNYQYRHEKFEANIFPGKDDFSLKKGEWIAYSGNTGRSGGPHLHFEIRRTRDEVPLNILLFPFKIKDNIAPSFNQVVIYPLSDTSFIEAKQEKLKLKPLFSKDKITVISNPVEFYGPVGFGIEGYDYLNGVPNRCGIYRIEVYVNDRLHYAHEIDDISFDKSRYINSMVDQELYMKKREKVQKLYKEPNNRLDIYKHLTERGILIPRNDSVYNVDIKIIDVYNNSSELSFQMKINREFRSAGKKKKCDGYIGKFPYNRSNRYVASDIEVIVPSYSLYADIDFCCEKTDSSKKFLSPVYKVNEEYTQIHKSYTLRIRPYPFNTIHESKLLIAALNDNGTLKSLGGEWFDGFVETHTRTFGKLVVAIDTLPPVIKPISFRNKASYKSGSVISFLIRDELSGIKTYNGYIDGKWALFEYDAKSDKLFYIVDKQRLKKDKLHDLKLYVIDQKKNLEMYHGQFYY